MLPFFFFFFFFFLARLTLFLLSFHCIHSQVVMLYRLHRLSNPLFWAGGGQFRADRGTDSGDDDGVHRRRDGGQWGAGTATRHGQCRWGTS